MKGQLALLLATSVATSASAAPDWRSMSTDCLKLQTDPEIAACLRAGVDAQIREEEKENAKKLAEQQAKLTSPRLLVRESASSISNFGAKGFGEKGASLTVQRDKGDDSTLAKAAVFAIFDPWVKDGKSQPFLGLAWARDGAAKPKTDIRQLTGGFAGQLFQTSGEGAETLTVFHTIQLSRRYDRYAATDGAVARAHFDLAWGPLANGTLLGGLAVLPHVAGLWHHRTEGATEAGNWRSLYAGVQLEKPVLLGLHHFKLSAVARKLFDTSVPSGNQERRQRYLSLSMDYFFYDPDNKTAALQPSLFITRETGMDFLEFGKAVNKTTAGFRLKFN